MALWQVVELHCFHIHKFRPDCASAIENELVEIALTAWPTIGSTHVITMLWLCDSESVAHENAETPADRFSYLPDWPFNPQHSPECSVRMTEGVLTVRGLTRIAHCVRHWARVSQQ